MKLALAPVLAGAAAASSSIRADSKAGRKLLDRARRLDGGNDNMSWAAGYSLKFQQCVTTTERVYFGGNQDNNNNENNQNYNGGYKQHLVHFKLCPSESCGSSSKSSCEGGASYVLDMNEFVMAYMEYKREAEEQECEYVAENCYCNGDDEEACEAQCYMNAGIYEQCVEQENNGQEEEFELEQALECGQLDVDEDAMQYYMYQGNGANGNYNYNGNNNNNNGGQDLQLFVGPYCSADGSSIVLGVFMDEFCSYDAPEGIYEGTHYGRSLPYSTESIVSKDCISCMQPPENDGNNNGNQNYNYNNNGNDNYNQYYQNNNGEEPEILEFCERIYEDAGKCERDLNAYGVYPNTMACDFIDTLKSGMRTKISSTFSNAKNATPAILAGVFAATTVAFAGAAYMMHKKLKRQSVGLVHSEGTLG